jgi:hypothetical protein
MSKAYGVVKPMYFGYIYHASFLSQGTPQGGEDSTNSMCICFNANTTL